MEGLSACTIQTHAASDGYSWKYRRYPPPAGTDTQRPTTERPATGRERPDPNAHLVCVHGIQSHGGWYEHSCTRLAEAGYLVSFLDRRGSGMNEQARGDAPGFRRLIDDIAEFVRASPVRPVFLLAVSWGGKLATALCKRHPGLIDGLLLVCPGYFPQVKPRLGQRLRILWSRLVAPSRLFSIPLNDPELFTANPKWQQFLREDPRALHQATARLLIESVRLDGYLRVVPKHVTMPVLLLLAQRDRIIKNDATRRYVERFASADKQVIEYPGAHHTLEFEPDPEVFIRDLLSWLQRHVSAK